MSSLMPIEVLGSSIIGAGFKEVKSLCTGSQEALQGYMDILQTNTGTGIIVILETF